MASISFAQPGDAPGFFPNTFEPAGGASFQMNPLSAHPPRAPRASHDTYAPEPEPLHEVEVDADDERTRKRAARLRREAVWRDMLATSTGRDKAFKVLQYGLKLYLLFHTSLAATRLVRRPRAGAWDHTLLERLDVAVGKLSLSRKCLILFDWLAPLDAIRAQHSSGGALGTAKGRKPLLHSVLHAPPPVLLGLVQALADDVSTAAKLGLLGGAAGARAGRFADWCLFASTLVNLVENAVERSVSRGLQQEVESRLYEESLAGPGGVYTRRHEEKELQRLRTKDHWMRVQRTKLLMDLLFVSFDVFNINRGKRTTQTFAGLASGVLGFSKLYNTHKVKLLGATSL